MPRHKIYPVTCHTDHVGRGTTFVVIQGYTHNGTEYIKCALEKGAQLIVADQSLPFGLQDLITLYGAQFKRVANARRALALLSAQASDYAHRKLKIIAITGTKGKTTTANILFHILQNAGIKVALISTTGNAIGSRRFPAHLTTPQPDYLHNFFKEAFQSGMQWVVMEVAAQAVSLHRIEGLRFSALLMTNIGREHLEFYGSMDAYVADKLKLLKFRKLNASAWINKDDTWLKWIEAKSVHWFGMGVEAELAGNLLATKNFSLSAEIFVSKKKYTIACPTLLGSYNLSNILAAIAGAMEVGLSSKKIATGLVSFPGIPGRQEQYVLSNGALAIIDYAHNPLSYKALFSTIRPLTNHLVLVFGAGGDRDSGRRPEMGELAAFYGDQIIITTDNPRTENPEDIVEGILSGIPEEIRSTIIIEPNRKKAIKKAYELSKKGSILALLGKGPDEYQLVGEKKIRFSERKILKSL